MNFDVVERDLVTNIVFSEPHLSMDDLGDLTKIIKERGNTGPMVLRNGGPDFCVRLVREASTEPQTAEQIREGVLWPILNLYLEISAAPYVVIAAVRGRAFGLGFAIAASCDLIFASEDAQFAVPELSTGVPPLLALSALVRILPRQAAFGAVVSSGSLTAARMLAMGAVADVVPDEKLVSTVDALSDSLAALPAVSHVKDYLNGEPNAERAADLLGTFFATA